jgi:outer membrane protein assembly factor BamB
VPEIGTYRSVLDLKFPEMSVLFSAFASLFDVISNVNSHDVRSVLYDEMRVYRWSLMILIGVFVACSNASTGTSMSVPIANTSIPSVVSSTSTTINLESTSTSTVPVEQGPNPDLLWSAAGVGMSDAFFPDNRLLAADDERVYVADGWGGLNETPSAAMTSLSAVSGDRLWKRTDLSKVTYNTGLFIQLLTRDRLVVNDEEGLLSALAPATGETIWSIDFPVGYSASGAIASEDVIYIGAHATSESDTRPPVAYAIHLHDGSVIWQTTLAEGLDLQPVSPALSDGSALFSMTLSHPGSAAGNMIHILSSEDGSVQWDLDLGGEQQFKFFPTLVRGNIAIVPGWDETLGVSLDTGATVWLTRGVQPLVQTEEGRALVRTHQGIAEIDWLTGETDMLAQVDWSQVVYRPNGTLLINDQLVVSDGLNLRSYSVTDGEPLWSWAAPGIIVDNHVAVGGTIAVPVGNQFARDPDDRRVVLIDPPP